MSPRLVHLLLVITEMQQVAISLTDDDLESAEDLLDFALRVGRARQELDSLEYDAIDLLKKGTPHDPTSPSP